MDTLTVKRNGVEARLTIEEPVPGRITRNWSGDPELARECERAIGRYLSELPDGPTLDLPPARIDVAQAAIDPFAHRILCRFAIERFVRDVAIIDRTSRKLNEEVDVFY
jgi:hypothetical protein